MMKEWMDVPGPATGSAGAGPSCIFVILAHARARRILSLLLYLA
jgi:hypothetical protein